MSTLQILSSNPFMRVNSYIVERETALKSLFEVSERQIQIYSHTFPQFPASITHLKVEIPQKI